jgi:type IV pilus assembly protein PilA
MIQRISDRLHREDKGFTLIELMVVVLIIAILIAIAIPTFLGARKRAQDRSAQSSLRNGVTAAKAIFTDKEDYAQATEAALDEGEPALDFVTGANESTDQTVVSFASAIVNQPVGAVKHNRFYSAALSDSGTCWFVQDIAGPAGTVNAGTTWEQVPNAATCKAADALAYDNGAWKKRPGDTS